MDWFRFSASDWEGFTADDWEGFSSGGSASITITLPDYTDESCLYSVYAGSWGGTKESVNLSTPSYTSPTMPLTYVVPAPNDDETMWMLIRKTVGGIEEKNWNWIQVSVQNSIWVGDIPQAPTLINVNVLEGNIPQLQFHWDYSTPVPDGFNVYVGSGVVATVPYVGENVMSINLPMISTTTSYQVAAYVGNVIGAKSDYISVTPYGDLIQIPFSGDITWTDQTDNE